MISVFTPGSDLPTIAEKSLLVYTEVAWRSRVNVLRSEAIEFSAPKPDFMTVDGVMVKGGPELAAEINGKARSFDDNSGVMKLKVALSLLATLDENGKPDNTPVSAAYDAGSIFEQHFQLEKKLFPR